MMVGFLVSNKLSANAASSVQFSVSLLEETDETVSLVVNIDYPSGIIGAIELEFETSETIGTCSNISRKIVQSDALFYSDIERNFVSSICADGLLSGEFAVFTFNKLSSKGISVKDFNLTVPCLSAATGEDLSYQVVYNLPDFIAHQYEKQEVVLPTCTESGYTQYVCSVCGDTYKDFLEAFGHSYFEGTCSICNTEIEELVEESLLYVPLDDMVFNADNYYANSTKWFYFIPEETKTYYFWSDSCCESVGVTLYDEHMNSLDTETINNGSAFVESYNFIEGNTYYLNVYLSCMETCHYGQVKGIYVSVSENFISNHDYVKSIVFPNCLDHGYTNYSCTRCDANYTSDYTEALGHDYNENGICKNCSILFDDSIETDHPYNYESEQIWTIYKLDAHRIAITFSKDSELDYWDDNLYVYDSDDSMIAQLYRTNISGKTVIIPGDTVKLKLEVGGNNYNNYGFALSNVTVYYDTCNEHLHTELINQKEQTCSENGYTGDLICTDCGYVIEQGETLYAEHLDTEPEYIKTIKADCNYSGYDLYFCSVCREVFRDNYTDSVHSSPVVVEVVEPICGWEQGYTVYKCSDCGEEYRDDYIWYDSHTIGEIIDQVEPECGGQGYITYLCSVCGEESTEWTYLEHTKGEVVKVVEPVCGGYNEDGGYTVYRCSHCGDNFKSDFIWLEHTPGEMIETVEPVCGSESGYTTYNCSNCGKKFNSDWVWLDHVKGEEVKTVEPICGRTNGYTVYKCSNCNKEFEDDYTWQEHDINQVIEVVEPLCGIEGYTKYRCTCGTIYKNDYTYKWHDGELIEKTQATCTMPSYFVYKCNDCGDQFTEWAAPSLDHTIENGVCTRCSMIVQEIKLNEFTDVNITNEDEKVYFKFTPEKDGTYYLFSDSCDYTCGYLYDSEMNLLDSYDGLHSYTHSVNGAVGYGAYGDLNFKIECELKAGQVYYLAVCYGLIDEIGMFKVKVADEFNSIHSYEIIEKTLPTCNDSGWEFYECVVCGRKDVVCYADPIGHNYVDGLCKNCGCHENNHILDVKVLESSSLVIDEENNVIYGINSGVSLFELEENYLSLCDEVSVYSDTEIVGTGTVITFESNYETLAEYTVVVFGDTDGNSWYDGQDAIIVDCLANGMLTKEDVGEAVYTAADCNHDGVIDQADVALLNEAGALLSNVDQTKPADVLLETSAEYVEYLDLIDQSPEIEIEDETDTPEVDVEDTPEADTEDVKVDIFEMIMNFIKSIFEMLLSYIPMPIK